MASKQIFVDYVCEQLAAAGQIRQQKMFGEYAIYCDEKLIALVCDDQFFLKPSKAVREALGVVQEAPPYPGAKPSFLLNDALEDAAQISHLARLTYLELPAPKPKKPKAAKKT
jgi:DNA transformation protein and related proteins